MSDEMSREELLRIASAAAHQLKSPLSTVQTILGTLIGGFAGPLDARQRWLLQKALERCTNGVGLVADVMKLRTLEQLTEDAFGPVSMVAVVNSAVENHEEKARQRGVALRSTIDVSLTQQAVVNGHPGLMREIVSVLIDNAIKYTPKDGSVAVRLFVGEDGRVVVEVVDSGIGVPPEEMDLIFEEFHRAPNAKAVSSGGSGLGLSFARRAAERVAGRVGLEPADSGGTRAFASFPRSDEEVAEDFVAREAADAYEAKQKVTQRVVIIGGVAAGSKAAAKIMRLDPYADLTIVERGRFLAYSGCSLPHYIAGTISDQGKLLESPLGAQRDSSFFHDLKNVHTLELTEAVRIDREKRVVRVKNLLDDRESDVPYDKLILATGTRARKPDVPGVDLDGIFTLHGVEDAEAIRARLRSTKVKDVVIVGGGLLGCQITEAVAMRGARLTLVESQSSILGIVDREIAMHVAHHIESHGVRVLTEARALAFEPVVERDGEVAHVVLEDGRKLPCDFVLLASGIEPEVGLAREAGLEIGTTGAIKVDRHTRTNDPDIYAIGDCAEQYHVVTDAPAWLPGSAAAAIEGRIAAVNLCGGDETYPGVAGTIIVKVFDAAVARTGLTERRARKEGIEPISVLVPGPDRASFLPEAKPILLKLVADKATGRLIGAEAFGKGEIVKRIDVLATALMSGMTLDQVAHLNLGYSPHFSMALDNVIIAANVLRNKLQGVFEGVSPLDLAQEMVGDDPPFLLDVRLIQEFNDVRLRGSRHIPLGVLRSRVQELPRDKPIVCVCSIGLRSYEASLILKRHGFENVRVLDGGLQGWPYSLERLA